MANGTTAAHVQDDLQRARWASAANAVAGVWLILAPFVLNFEQANNAQWNSVAVGAAVTVLAAIRAMDPDHREGISWVNVVLGIWMIAAPFVLNYNAVNDAQNNSIIMGVIILALAAFSAYETNHAHSEEERSRREMT